MKYSLRSLMIVVTLICVVPGSWFARVDFLRRNARFHESEAARFLKEIQDSNHIGPEQARMIAENASDDIQGFLGVSDGKNMRNVPIERNADTCAFLFHRRMTVAYSAAIHRP